MTAGGDQRGMTVTFGPQAAPAFLARPTALADQTRLVTIECQDGTVREGRLVSVVGDQFVCACVEAVTGAPTGETFSVAADDARQVQVWVRE